MPLDLNDHDFKPQTKAAFMTRDLTEQNLAIVDAHIKGEGRDPSSVMSLYTDDIVLDMPTRGITLHGKATIEANYRRMFGAMELISMTPIERFATFDRVIDDGVARFKLVREGFDNAPYPIGSTIDLRLLHVFHMKDGKIARETVFEGWTRID
ncbi:nuclear transport factor 2 family protein [Asticcacaulis sp. ZE23SCel15]|uniref:nuclear transport factor 2 family protein n=1 Tax=Asticcacaulis sp. ZE23SCel15 TaxID=3059027 RepID=UPI00265F1519|nr:nuclear transport factor 2 family protein [Asticcacaulis sp. ZE23SCel15]WKL57672.1 nuclear transport factor 2 family protein [Asticcacaulis sp. ZE23SCel15]